MIRMQSANVAVCFLLILLSSVAMASETPIVEASAKSCQEKAFRNDLNYSVARIMSAADLKEYLSHEPKASPLRSLSKNGRNAFIESLSFNSSGLTGYNYAPLDAELTVSEAYRVLALFGDQHNTLHLKSARVESDLDAAVLDYLKASAAPNDMKCSGRDYPDYRCESHATCALKTRYLCKSNC